MHMLVVTGTIRLAPGDGALMREAARDMAQATRTETGCAVYEFFEDIEVPGRFRVYEEWDSLAALEAHFATEHMAVFRAALSRATVISRDVVRFERGDATAL
jgi:quinol monooxygenase YgiN